MKPILCDPDVKSNLQALHEHFAVVIIENAANNFAFIWKKYYISKLLAEVGVFNSISKIYSKATHSIDEIIEANINLYFINKNLINYSQLCTGYLKCIRHAFLSDLL